MANKSSKTDPVPDDYVGVWAWGDYMGSHSYYIEQEQRKAVRDRAPLDAMYYSDGLRRWVCVSDLSESHPFRETYRAATRGQPKG